MKNTMKLSSVVRVKTPFQAKNANGSLISKVILSEKRVVFSPLNKIERLTQPSIFLKKFSKFLKP